MKQKREDTLKNLTRKDLLELLVEQNKKIDALSLRLEEVEEELSKRRIMIEQSGSIAEASLRLNGVFEAAQKACDQYLDNIRMNGAAFAEERRMSQRQTSLEKKLKQMQEQLREQKPKARPVPEKPNRTGAEKPDRTVPENPNRPVSQTLGSRKDRHRNTDLYQKTDAFQFDQSEDAGVFCAQAKNTSGKVPFRERDFRTVITEKEDLSDYPTNICGVDFTRFPQHIFGDAGEGKHEK